MDEQIYIFADATKRKGDKVTKGNIRIIGLHLHLILRIHSVSKMTFYNSLIKY